MTTSKYNLSPSYIPKILFVDDEENILKSMSRLSVGENYMVVTCNSPRKALEMVRQAASAGVAFAVVVSDHQMPEMAGTHFLEQVKYVSPDTVRILMTGYTDARMAIDAINRGAIYRYIEKPWQDELLRNILNDATRQFTKGLVSQRLEMLTKKYQSELMALHGGNSVPAAVTVLPQVEESEPVVQAAPQPNSIALVSPGAEGFMERVNSLTRREKDLLYCIVRGYSNQQIADELTISITTVKNHIGNIFRKLEVANRTQAAMMATAVFAQNGKTIPTQQVC